jgi:hypothetical protein
MSTLGPCEDCGTELADAGSIGVYCPNQECPGRVRFRKQIKKMIKDAPSRIAELEAENARLQHRIKELEAAHTAVIKHYVEDRAYDAAKRAELEAENAAVLLANKLLVERDATWIAENAKLREELRGFRDLKTIAALADPEKFLRAFLHYADKASP